MKKISSNILGSFILVSSCSAQPAMAQSIISSVPAPEDKTALNLLDIGKPLSTNDKMQPLLTLNQSLDESGNKNLAIEFGKYTTEASNKDSALSWQIAPGMEMKAKYKRIKFTLEF